MIQRISIKDLDSLSTFTGLPLVLLDANGVILASSQNIPHWLDYHDLGEPLAGRMLLFFDEDGQSLPEDKHPLNQVLDAGLDIREASYCLSRDDTGPVMALVSITSTAIDEKGQRGVLLAIHPGAADRRQDESGPNLSDLQNTLAEQQSSQERMLSMMHHDLKSPLMGLEGVSNILLQGHETMLPHERLRLLQMMHRTAAHTYLMFDKLFSWALTQSNAIKCQKKPLEIGKLLRENILVLAHSAEQKQIDIKIECPEDIWIFADETMLGSVVQNLVSNGIKFTTHGGHITLTVKDDQSQVEIKVRDTGVGMNKDTLQRLFKAHQKSSSPGTDGEKGTGLGLLLCQEFVERNGGKLIVQSELSKGSEFTVSFPLFGIMGQPKQSA